MISEYLEFNVARFVKDCFEKEKILPSLKAQLEDLDGQRGIDTSRDKVQESANLDNVHNVAMLRIKLENRIEDCEKDIAALKKAMKALTPDEHEAVVICFNGDSITRQRQERNIEERTLFNRRKKALEKNNHAFGF